MIQINIPKVIRTFHIVSPSFKTSGSCLYTSFIYKVYVIPVWISAHISLFLLKDGLASVHRWKKFPLLMQEPQYLVLPQWFYYIFSSLSLIQTWINILSFQKCSFRYLLINNIVCTPFLSAGEEGGWTPNQIFKGGLDRTSIFRRGWLFLGGLQFLHKNALKSEIFNDKKSL